jgi:hypothetical protein
MPQPKRSRFIVAAALLLLLPALIPLYFAFGQEPGGLRLALFALSAGLLVVNAGMLYVMYRWFQSTTKDARPTHHSSGTTNDHGSKEDL